MGVQKSFPVVFTFAVVSLLSCCQASNFFLPRVSRTDDAIIIDLDGVAPSYQGKTLYGQIANPGFIPILSFNPYPMMYRQQQRPSGWPYPSNKQFDGEDEEEEESIDVKQATSTCGRGPATMPKTGSLTSGRVSAGSDAKRGAWPFTVALKKGNFLFCGGTLISETKVLLAAQCLEKLSLNEMNTVTVLIGMYSIEDYDAQMTRRISKVFLHSKYNAFTYANDIAIITLDAPVVISRTVAPACLPLASTDPDQFVGQDAMIVGWGTADRGITNLQQGKVSIGSNSECRMDATIGKYMTDNTTCITSDSTAVTCSIDVGGPVVTLPSPGAWTVVGINSYTQECGCRDCTTSAIKTRVSAYREWIDQYMKAK